MKNYFSMIFIFSILFQMANVSSFSQFFSSGSSGALAGSFEFKKDGTWVVPTRVTQIGVVGRNPKNNCDFDPSPTKEKKLF